LVDTEGENKTGGNIALSWSRFYKSRLKIRSQYPDFWKIKVKKKHLQVILEEVHENDKILDVGSHDRLLKDSLKEKHVLVTYKSMDIDRQNFHDYYSLDEIDEKFDIIFLFEVIEHMEFKEGGRILKKLYSLLDKGGKLILTTPNLFHPNVFWDSDHKTPYRYDEIGGLLLESGFRINNIYRLYNDAFFRRLFRLYIAAPLHRFLCIDFAKSILIVAQKKI
jgi:SAM-dependent methyltransferase